MVRGDQYLDLIREMPIGGLNAHQFNDMTDFDIDVIPGILLDNLNEFNESVY